MLLFAPAAAAAAAAVLAAAMGAGRIARKELR